jgi:hypothetical protein
MPRGVPRAASGVFDVILIGAYAVEISKILEYI